MSVLTIVEASKQFNVTRPRIYRAIQKGELTTSLNDEGVQVVQVRSSVRTEMAVFLGAHQTIFDGYGYISYA